MGLYVNSVLVNLCLFAFGSNNIVSFWLLTAIDHSTGIYEAQIQPHNTWNPLKLIP